MTLIEQIAPGALGPGLTSAAVFTTAALLARHKGAGPLREMGTALAVAAGFAVGFAVVLGWPHLPPEAKDDAWAWVAWFAVGGWLVGWLERLPRVMHLLRLVVRTGVSALAAWLLVRPLAAFPDDVKLRLVLGGAAVMVILWSVAAETARRSVEPGRVVLPFLVAAGTGAAVLAFQSGSLSLGQTMGNLSAALGAALALALLFRIPAASPGTAPVIALVFGGLLLGAYTTLNYGDSIHFPLASALLISLGAVLGVLLPGVVPVRAGSFARLVVGALIPLLAVAAAAAVAHAGAPAPNPYGS